MTTTSRNRLRDRRRVDVPALLKLLGIDASIAPRGWKSRCPNPDHDDSNPSWSIVDDPTSDQHGGHNCFSCPLRGGPWELAAAVWGVSVQEAGRRLAGDLPLAAPPSGSVTSYRVGVGLLPRRPCEVPDGVVWPRSIDEWPEEPLAYLRGRRVTDSQVLQWGMGYSTTGVLRHRVVMPVVSGGVLVSYSARTYRDDRRRYLMPSALDGARGHSALLGVDLVCPIEEKGTLLEGWPSTLAAERGGWPNVLGILGSDVTPHRVAQIVFRAGIEVLYVLTDPDAAGAKAAEMAAAMSSVIRVIRVLLPASADDMSDDDLAEIRDRYP